MSAYIGDPSEKQQLKKTINIRDETRVHRQRRITAMVKCINRRNAFFFCLLIKVISPSQIIVVHCLTESYKNVINNVFSIERKKDTQSSRQLVNLIGN